MQALLHRIGIAREQVTMLGEPARQGRERLASEALRPAAVTDRWKQLAGSEFSTRLEIAVETLSVIEAANAGEEALSIAIALREAAETPGRTAALVTPDRALARRVLAALERWRVAVDDSGGDALADTPAGTFARLAVETALAGVPPVSLLALLKHPLARLGAAERTRARAIAALEKAVLRGPRPQASPTVSFTRSASCALSLPSCGAANPPICIGPIRASSSRPPTSTRPLISPPGWRGPCGRSSRREHCRSPSSRGCTGS